MIRRIDFSCATKEDQERILQMFFKLFSEEDKNHYEDQYFYGAIIQFCLTTELSTEELEKEIERLFPSFYNEEFCIEMCENRGEDFSKFIYHYLDIAHSRNATQGVNGVYHGYLYDCLDVINRIIENNDIELEQELFTKTTDIVIETLTSNNQTISAKISAAKLLQLLYFQNTSDKKWEELYPYLESNIELFSNGFENSILSKDSSEILSFQYELFLSTFNQSHMDLLVERVFSISYDDAYSIKQVLEFITDYLNKAQALSIDTNLLSAFLYFSITMTQHRENAVKAQATRCLVELTGYSSTKKLALMHLSRIIDLGSPSEKIAIITRLTKIKADDDLYKTQIINKGKIDNNYLVRFITERERQKDK